MRHSSSKKLDFTGSNLLISLIYSAFEPNPRGSPDDQIGNSREQNLTLRQKIFVDFIVTAYTRILAPGQLNKLGNVPHSKDEEVKWIKNYKPWLI